MRHTLRHWPSALAIAALLVAGLLAWPSAGAAQTVTGEGTAVKANVSTLLGTTTTALGDTGVIGTTNVEQDVSQETGTVASLVNADVLSSSTYSYLDEVDSESSLADLVLTVGTFTITADSVLAQASQVKGDPGNGTAFVDNLAIGGVPIAVTGSPNQTVGIPGGQMIINEQTISSTGGAVVNALHVIVSGVADVVIGSAKASIF